MATAMKENGKMEKRMVKDLNPTNLTEVATRENTSMISHKVEAFLLGVIKKNTKAIGDMESFMVKE